MVELGIPQGMAEHTYAPLCLDASGNVDGEKFNAVLSLVKAYGVEKTTNDKGKVKIKVNISPKDISDIFAIAIGNALSSRNGEFRPEIIADIVTLKNAGVEDLKLASSMAAFRNMGAPELHSRFNKAYRDDIAKQLDALPEDLIEKITSLGIDFAEIREIALDETKGGKVRRADLKPVKYRSLESIEGSEKVVLNT